MKLSMKWLSDFTKVDPKLSLRDYSEALTMSGSKVEGYEKEGEEISNVVVGKVLSMSDHPDSDHLVVCQIDVGSGETVQIVTGADNVVVDALVPVALHKSSLVGGKKITKGKLRGVESQGMLCSIGELGLTLGDFPYADENGIFLLQEHCEIGQDIQSAIGLDDVCVEFEITSNRPDCLAVRGLARETAATFGTELELPTPKVSAEGEDISKHLSVEVQNPTLCPRYIARMVSDVKIAPSPRWMRERLRASGVRPINNIVDITNYVMLEYGQPMHAFDHKFVSGGKIVVRNATEGESITTLDGTVHGLSPEMLAICDAEKPSAVAGVMGGEYSGIADDTTMIVFESANFLGSSVRLTAKKLGLRTESSGRFEKGLDAKICMEAVDRACELVEQLGAGTVLRGAIDIDNSATEPVRVPFTPDWINEFLGICIPAEEMVDYLQRLGFVLDGNDIIVPSFRSDIKEKADVAEEVARIYGYNRIPTTALQGLAEGGLTPRQQFDRAINETLLSAGLYEVCTYSFVSPKYYDKIGLSVDCPMRESVVITNPLGEDTSVMRTTALPSMLEVLSHNYNNRNLSAAFYEIATEYTPRKNDLPLEVPHVMMGMYGGAVDYFTIKGVAELLLERLDVSGFEFRAKSDHPTFHPGRCAEIVCGEQVIGTIGEVHPAVCETYGIATGACAARLNADMLFELQNSEKQYTPLPKYPATTRDLAIICGVDMPVATLGKAITSAAGKLLEKLELFDVYSGEQIEAGKKSVAYNLTLRATDRTLTVEEVDGVVGKVLKSLAEVGATLRA